MSHEYNEMKPLYVGQSKNGDAVYAGTYFSPGDRITQFNGPVLSFKDINGKPVSSYAVQFGPDEYFGLDGGFDDNVNHSCCPNAGLKWIDNELWLVAIWWIFRDDEITFDYSTTIGPKDPWTMKCNCGSPFCRQTIEKFDKLPKELRDYYTKIGVALAADWKP